MKNIRIDDLQINNLKIKQDKNLFCFGTDSVLLANFASPKKNAVVLDIGTGNGIIPVLLTAKTFAKKIVGIEVQKESAELAKENVLLNSLEEKIKIINQDINTCDLQPDSFDYITCNPPYKQLGTGITNESSPLMIARHEILCTLEDIIKISSKLLKSKGKLALVHKPERLAEIIILMNKYKIEPKKLQMVYSRINSPPCMILIEGMKNGCPELKHIPPLYIYDENGNYSANIAKLYKKGENHE